MLFFRAALTLLLIIKPPANTARCFVLVTLWASHPSGWLFSFEQIALVTSVDQWRWEQQTFLSQPVQEMDWRGSGAALGWLRNGLHVLGHFPSCPGVPACLLACNHCPQELCCPLWGLLWLQTWFAGGLGSKERPGSRSLCSVDAGEQHGMWEGWRAAPSCRLGRREWLPLPADPVPEHPVPAFPLLTAAH